MPLLFLKESTKLGWTTLEDIFIYEYIELGVPDMKFVFDLDGTICFKGVPISKRIIHALRKMEERGHQIIFASARPIRDMLPVIDSYFHKNILIGGNGSLIAERKNIIYTQPFSLKELEYIKSLIKEFNATYLIDGEWNYTYTGAENHPILKNLDTHKMAKNIHLDNHNSIIKILILSCEDMEKLEKKLLGVDVVTHRHQKENLLDISPKNIHKRSALEQLNIKNGEYIAFGNDANDISMFKDAAHSVMIGFHEELSKYATEFIPVDEDLEHKIIKKLYEISEKYHTSKSTTEF